MKLPVVWDLVSQELWGDMPTPRVVRLTESVVEKAKQQGIDVHEFYMRHYGAKVEVARMMPLSE